LCIDEIADIPDDLFELHIPVGCELVDCCPECPGIDQTIYWRVELLGDDREISIHVHQVHDLPAGKSHELWVLPAKGGAPVSLGLLPHTGDHHRVLTASQRAALAGAKTIAVSLEPEGGSPSGAPTGPVVYTGKLIETVPPAAPAPAR